MRVWRTLRKQATTAKDIGERRMNFAITVYDHLFSSVVLLHFVRSIASFLHLMFCFWRVCVRVKSEKRQRVYIVYRLIIACFGLIDRRVARAGYIFLV